ncbi:NXPE family member 4 isoform X2 [Pogona vitticeps]
MPAQCLTCGKMSKIPRLIPIILMVFAGYFYKSGFKFSSNSGALTKQGMTDQTAACVDHRNDVKEIEEIVTKLDHLIPNVTFRDIKTVTSAKNSQATIVNRQDVYCVGDHLAVRLDLYDHVGKRKEHGGDFLRARIYSPNLKAGASGLVQDHGNGTYLVDFTLFWEGNVSVSLLLIHPSEAISALWRARKKGYDKIGFTGKFLNGISTVNTECGFKLNRSLELCAYLDERDQEAFYCVKPKNVPCEAFVSLKSHNNPISYLTTLERSLLNRPNIGVEIPHKFREIHVVPCECNKAKAAKTCWAGAQSPFPSGFAWQNQWHPLFCNMTSFNTEGKIRACLQAKLIYFMGDSTVRQWIENLKSRLKTLDYLNVHVSGKPQKLIAVDVAENIQLRWKKHGHPYIGSSEYTVKDHTYVARDIDRLSGDQNTVVVISLGQHFRPFPIEFFIQRAIRIREAVQRLLLRSPDTRVVVKGENTREMTVEQELFSDFHGYSQYLALKDVFRDLNVGFIDTWDMTVAFDTNSVHPPNHVVRNEVDLLLSYIC